MILLKFGGITMPKSEEEKLLEEDEDGELDIDSEESESETLSDDEEF
jgi:hypothetical protein